MVRAVVIVPTVWPSARKVAARLVAEGATVVLVGENPDSDMLAEVQAAGKGRTAFFHMDSFHMDAGTPEELDALLEFVNEQFGR